MANKKPNILILLGRRHRDVEHQSFQSRHDGLPHPKHLIPRCAYLKNEIPVAGVAHQGGTCRFGKDPKTSVLDVNCKAHELDNLYVVDTSFFVSIGAVNPSLTAMANEIRVGEHLAERLK
jgi:choline dehydrogenase-like flavoprotein